MNKTQIDLSILLPGLPDEKDECVDRIVDALKDKRGIDRVHVVPAKNDNRAQLCFHYNPEVIAINEIEHLARNAGALITEQFGHLLLTVSGINILAMQELSRLKLKNWKGSSVYLLRVMVLSN